MTSALLSSGSSLLLRVADYDALVVYVVYVVVVVRRPFSSSPSKKMGAGKSTLPMIGLDPNIMREEDTLGVFSSKMTLMDDDDDAKETIVVDRRHKIASSSPATKGMATKTQLAEVCVVAPTNGWRRFGGATMRLEAWSKTPLTDDETFRTVFFVKNERTAARPKGFRATTTRTTNNANEEDTNEEGDEENNNAKKKGKGVRSLDDGRGVAVALNGEAGNGLVKIRSQFIGNETSGVRDAQVVATAYGKGCLKERLEVFVERSRLVVVGIDDDDDEDEDDDVGGNDGGECRVNEQDSRAKLRRKRKKGDAKRNRVDILDDEMAAGVKFMPPSPTPPTTSVSSRKMSPDSTEGIKDTEGQLEQSSSKTEESQRATKEKRERLKTYATVRVTPTKSSVQATVSNAYAPLHTLTSSLFSLSSIVFPSFDEQFVLHKNISNGTTKALLSCRAEKDVLENKAGKIRFAQRVSIDSNGNGAKSIRASFTHTNAEDKTVREKEISGENEPTRKKKTRTNAVTVNLREKKSRGRIKTDETVDSDEQRFEKRRACTLALRHADPEKGSTVSLELAKRLKDSTFCPKLNVAKQFYESIDDDGDDNEHHHREYQQQTYKFSVTIASRLVETELSRKFKLTESIEGEIVLAAKLAAWRHFAYINAEKNERDAMVGVYLGSPKDWL